MDTPPSPNSADLALRVRKRKTLVFLVVGMLLMGVIGLGMALATVKFRRTRDISSSRLTEAALLDRMPGNCRQLLVCKPGWGEFGPILGRFPEIARLGPLESGPVQWSAGAVGTEGPAFLVADWGQDPNRKFRPAGWIASGELWLGQNPPSEKAGVPAGLDLMVRTRLGQNPAQVAVWTAGMGVSWQKGWGQYLWKDRLGPDGQTAELFSLIKNWVAWIERQPDRYILRAELECPDNRAAASLEKTLEGNLAKSPNQWEGIRFLADGPWISLQAPLGKTSGSNP